MAACRWNAPALLCQDGSVALASLPDRPLGAEDVVVVPLGDAFRIVWVVTNRFAGGACVAPAFFHLGREEAEPLPSGWRRKYRLDATLEFSPVGAMLREQVVVNDVDPRHPNAPPRQFRRAESEIPLQFNGRSFGSAERTLWTRMLEAR